MFFRVKPAGSYRYLQIAHSVRQGQKVRQQVIATLGRVDLLEASGQLKRLCVRVCGTVRSLLSLTLTRPAKSNRSLSGASGRTWSLLDSGKKVGSRKFCARY